MFEPVSPLVLKMYEDPTPMFVPAKLSVALNGVYESDCAPTLVIVVVPVGISWKLVTAEFYIV